MALEGRITVNVKNGMMGSPKTGGIDAIVSKIGKIPEMLLSSQKKAQREAIQEEPAKAAQNLMISANIGRVAEKEPKGAMMTDIVKEKGKGGAGGMMGGIGDMIGGMGKGVAILAIIAGAITMLVKSSALLQGVLGGIGKLLMLIIRPLGDILGIALMPLLYIMKPIGIFFNTLMKPYLQKAMAAMKAGGALLKAGDVGGAMGAFVLGAQYLIKPFFDMFIRGSEVLISGLIDVADTMTGGIFHEGLMSVKEGVRSAGESIISTTTNFLDYQLGRVLAKAETTTGTSMMNIIKKLDDAEIGVGYASGMVAAGIVSPLAELSIWVGDSWGPEFKSIVQTAMNNAIRNASIAIPKTPTYTYGVPQEVYESLPSTSALKYALSGGISRIEDALRARGLI